MCELNHKEDWVLKNWCFWIVMLEKTLESPLDCKEIKPDNPKGNQSWIFIGRTNAEAEIPVIWPLDVKNWLFASPWTAGCQTSLSFTNSWSLLKLCPLSWWCHPTISSSVVPFSSCLQSFPVSGSFLTSRLFALGGQSIGASVSASVLPVNIQD